MLVSRIGRMHFLAFCRSARRLVLVSLCASFCLLSACGDGGEIVDGAFASAEVYGAVTATTGDAVAAAIVRLAWRPGTTCDEPLSGAASDTTDALGRYRIGFGDFGEGGFTACTRVVADPPADSNLLPDTVVRAGIRMRSSGLRDSVEINLVLRPSG